MCLKEVTTVKVRCAKSSIPGDATARADEAFGPFPSPARVPPPTIVRGEESHVCLNEQREGRGRCLEPPGVIT